MSPDLKLLVIVLIGLTIDATHIAVSIVAMILILVIPTKE